MVEEGKASSLNRAPRLPFWAMALTTEIVKSRKRYNCPVEATVDVVGGKWKSYILKYLGRGPKRYSELKRLLPGMTERVLTQQLRELESHGVLARKVYALAPSQRVEYSLTDLGRTLQPVLNAMFEWGRKFEKTLEESESKTTKLSRRYL